jgi:uncharacterized membrane protein
VTQESHPTVPGKAIAIISEALYGLNLLFSLLPLLGLLWLYFRYHDHPADLARIHLRQALAGALVVSAIFLGANLLILVLGGYRSMATLIVFEVYYIAVVPLFLIPGLLGLIKAMAGEPYRYPLIGRLTAKMGAE